MKGFLQPTQWPSILKLVANSFVSNLLLERVRKAFLEADNDQTLRRALIHRRHPSRGMYQQGEWVMIWKKSGEADGNWHGPMQVITQEGSQVVWVSMGTKLFRVAPEHVRSLSAVEEWKHQNKDDTSRLTRSSNSIVPRHGGTQYHDLTEGQNIVSEPNPGAAPLGASPTGAEDQEQHNHPEEMSLMTHNHNNLMGSLMCHRCHMDQPMAQAEVRARNHQSYREMFSLAMNTILN